MDRQSSKILDGQGNIGTRDTHMQGLSAWTSSQIPDGLGNIGTQDTQTQGLGAWTDHPVRSPMVWVTLVHGILRLMQGLDHSVRSWVVWVTLVHRILRRRG